MSLESIMAEVDRAKRLAAEVVAAGPRPLALRRRGGYAVIHRSTYGDHDWRVSLLTEDESPIAHVDADDFATAVEAARKYGADFESAVEVLR